MPNFSPVEAYHQSPSSYMSSAPPLGYHVPTTSPPPSSSPSFFFRRRTGKLSWSVLSSVSLQSIISTVNVDLLQEHVESITYADINEADLSQATDAQIVHLIRLCQLTIEYLLNVQNYLLKLQRQKAKTYALLTSEMDRAKALLKLKDDEMLRLQQENKFLKKFNRHIQTSPPAPSKVSAVLGGGGEVTAHTCEYCRASFVSEVYLAGHIGRRHPDMAGRVKHRAKKPRRSPSSDSSDSDASPSRDRRRRREEEARARQDLQRQRDELEAERRKLQQEKEAAAKAAASPPTPPQSHHLSQRPAPIDVGLSKEWLENYTRDLEKRVREETLATLKSHSPPVDLDDKVARLTERLDSALKGPLSPPPQPDGGESRRAEELMAQTKDELLKEIAALKRAAQAPAPIPSSPSPLPPPSPESSMGGGDGLTRLVEAAQVKRFATFSDFPSLLSRFQHEEVDLQRRVRAFSEAVEGMGGEAGGEGEEWVDRVEERGYEEEERGVLNDVDRLMADFVDPALEQRWAGLLEREKTLHMRAAEEEQQREREKATRAATDRAQQQQLQAQMQVDRDRMEAQRRDAQFAVFNRPQPPLPTQTLPFQLQQPVSQQPFTGAMQAPQAFAQPLQPQGYPYAQQPPIQSQGPWTAQPTQAAAVPTPAPAPAPSVLTTDVDGLLRRQHEQAGVIDELRRQMQPATTASAVSPMEPQPLPMGADEAVAPRRGAIMAGLPVPRPREEMSEEELEEEDSPMPVVKITHHEALSALPAADDVESIDLDQPPSPLPVEEKTAEEEVKEVRGGGMGKQLQPIKREGGGFQMQSAAKRGSALPALAPRGAAVLEVPAPKVDLKAAFDSSELDEEEF